MKKKLLLLAGILLCVSSAFAITPTYKGYVEQYVGIAMPQNTDFYNGGSCIGFLTTSHGVQLFDGLFVGAGIDFAMTTYQECIDHPGTSNYDTDFSALFAVFAEGRYNFLPKKRISPFAGLRLGGGFNGYDEVGAFYFSPAVGCTFNLTKRFGLDVSLAYSVFTGDKVKEYVDWRDDYVITGHAGNINCLCLRFGLHF